MRTCLVWYSSVSVSFCWRWRHFHGVKREMEPGWWCFFLKLLTICPVGARNYATICYCACQFSIVCFSCLAFFRAPLVAVVGLFFRWRSYSTRLGVLIAKCLSQCQHLSSIRPSVRLCASCLQWLCLLWPLMALTHTHRGTGESVCVCGSIGHFWHFSVGQDKRKIQTMAAKSNVNSSVYLITCQSNNNNYNNYNNYNDVNNN